MVQLRPAIVRYGKRNAAVFVAGAIGNIAAILKAYPNVHLKIGGYTDNTGDATANMSLSAARAKNVMDALVNSRIDASRLSSEGYGEQYPVGDNSTEEGRAQNRRIAMRVTQK